MTSTRVLLACALLLAPLAACGGGHGANGAPQCSDGIDNDGDGLIDFPADPGCTSPDDDSEDSPPSPQCSDGRDNDGDGKIDYPNDPGCPSPLGDSEVDDCPSGPMCPQCANGKDDDGNGLIDYPADPGCSSAGDPIEAPSDPDACGGGVTVLPLPANGDVIGTITASSGGLVGSCGGSGAEAVYELTIPKAKVIVASTISSMTTISAVLYIRGAMCTDPASEHGCAVPASGAMGAQLTASVPAGTYYIVVDGTTAISTGTYELTVSTFPGVGAACTGPDDTFTCGPGLLCNNLMCTAPQCSDGIDNDGDGKIDYPNDPGCTSPSDNDETDDCPNGPDCPQCGNGKDDDGDGEIDYPADTSCKSASGTSEACTSTEPVMELTMGTTSGDTTGATDDFEPSCAFEPGDPDLTYQLDVPALATLNVTAADPSFNFFPVIAMYGATCVAPELACDEDPTDGGPITLTDLAAGTYYVTVDGDGGGTFGAFDLTVSGTIKGGESCESPLAVSGALTCASGYLCKGTAGARTCVAAACNDGSDNDGDGKIDYPNDPGCTSPSDDDETDDCPNGPNCPQCGNGKDDDGDGLIDYPADPSCLSASGTSESCTTTEGVIQVVTGMTMGNTTGATDDTEPSCADETGSPDLMYQLDLPPTTTLSIDAVDPTDSFFPTIAIFGASCGPTELACNEDPTDEGATVLTNLAAGSYFVDVDGDFGEFGPFTLTVSGTIATGGSCEGALATSGALTCTVGTLCKGTMGSRTCQRAACADGSDNDGDGKIDFPNDPGCSSPSDDDETDTCPGAGCPVCSDGSDNDGDGATDYPADFGCASAGGTSEVFCIGEADAAIKITAPTTTANTTGKHDNETPSLTCAEFAEPEPDIALSLQLPVAVADLSITDTGSSITTVLSFEDANCMTTQACALDSLDLTNVFPGNYAIVVDGYDDVGAVKITVKGTVKTFTPCTSPLFAAGVLVCPLGTSCATGICE